MSDKQLWPDAYIPREDAEAVVAEWKQRAEAAQKDADAMRCLAYECTQRKDAAEAALAAAEQRAEVAEAQERLAVADIAATERRMQADVDFWTNSAGEWKQRAEAAEAKPAEWQVAFGLLTTLAPVEIDITDPLGMAQAIERHVLAQQGEVQS